MADTPTARRRRSAAPDATADGAASGEGGTPGGDGTAMGQVAGSAATSAATRANGRRATSRTKPARRSSDGTGAGRPEPTLRILETRILRGPNYWSRSPVVRTVVDLGVLEEFPSNRIPGFVEALVELLPSLEDHACSLGRRGGFITRLREGTWLGHVAEHIALEFQNLAGTDVRHGKTRSTGEYGRYNVIYEFREEQVGVEAGRMAVGLVNHLVAPNDPEVAFDLGAELEKLIRLAERLAFGPSTQALIDEAASRDIPTIRLDRFSLVQLGQGVHQQRIRATMTSRTSAIAVDIASDKKLTNRLLDSAGLPVPRSEVVTTEDDAAAAARRIGFPCVVKPLDGNHGRGVALDLRDEDAVRAAFPRALAESRSRDVVVESYVTGNDYRCLVIGGRLAAVAERVPAGVTGDGEHSVRELVEIANRDPRRGIGHEKVLTRIRVDEAAEALVAAQGFAMDDVPPPGTRVKLALTGNMSTGGTSIDRTMEAHPDNIEIAETAARVVGLDIAGIDFICPDIATPVRETGGAIVEVNAAPGFRMHTHPTEGEPQYVARPVIDLLFPPGTPSRIPIVAVTGTNGKTTTVRMISHILKLMGRRVGMTSTDGIVVDGRLIKKGDMSGPKSAQMVLQNPTVDTAVFEVARGGILREGLGYDRNDVAVVTNVAGDHLGLGGIETLGQLANVKGVIVEAVPRSGAAVLNADDALVYRMGRHCAGRIVLFSMAKEKGEDGFDRVDGHAGRGNAAFCLEDTAEGELVVLRHGPRKMPVLYTHLIPATFGGRARMNVANALAAAAAAWALGAHLHDIRQGLRTFTTSFFQAPGRLNLLDVGGTRVFIDYCHNVDGMRQLADFVNRMMAEPQTKPGVIGTTGTGHRSGRAIGVIGIPGDRRDDDQEEYGAIAAQAFDELIVREDRNLRGRAPGETAEHVLAGIRRARGEGGRVRRAERILDELSAVRAALRRASPGDLIVMCVDDAVGVYREAMAAAGASRGGRAFADPGELEAPEG
ncbi:MAG TPA: cyanophycin synthetase [Candidatus Limnocylindrales bacterium]|nr:cyanophycin synthetase [Candidatus Limnocylindrales bacterium]